MPLKFDSMVGGLALLSDLVKTCGDCGLDSHATLAVFARRLREAGRVSKAGRGRSAARMTYLDAARFLIACAATDHPERAGDAERVFSELQFGHCDIDEPDLGLTKECAPTLEAGLAKVLEWFGKSEIERVASLRGEGVAMRVSLQLDRSTCHARLNILQGVFVYVLPNFGRLSMSMTRKELQMEASQIEAETLRFRTAKNLSARLEDELLREVGLLIAGRAAEGGS